MITIGQLQARKGEKRFGFLEAARTHADFPVHIPLHIVAGSNDGPTVLIQAGLSGLEIEPALTLPGIVEELDPQSMSGNLIMVPLLNTSAFEFEQGNSIWDGKDLNRLGKGAKDGTVSEQLLNYYFEEVVSKIDGMIDIHTGALWGYYRYAGVYKTGDSDGSCLLAKSLGLPQVLIGQPDDDSLAFEAAKAGKKVVSVWIGGGPGLRDNRTGDSDRVRATVLNALHHFGVISTEPENTSPRADVIEAHTVLKLRGRRGLTFMNKEKRGSQIEESELLGYVRHPYTGEILEEIRAPKAGILLHAGASWPVVPEGKTLAIIGDLVESNTS